jgi:hypothetical protein
LNTLPPSEKIINFETADNPHGAIAMSKENKVIAFLDKEKTNKIIAYDVNEEQEK